MRGRFWQLQLCVVALLMLLPLVAWFAKAEAPIELHASCKDHGPCRFIDDTIDVELDLFNAGTDPVLLPVGYFRQQGPKVILVDNHSGKEKGLGMGPPMGYLFDEMQELAPRQSIKIPWMIAPNEIDDFVLRPVDITVVFFISRRERLWKKSDLSVRSCISWMQESVSHSVLSRAHHLFQER